MDSNLITVNLQLVHNLESPDIDSLPWTRWFEIWGKYLEKYLPQGSGYELTLRLTDDREISQLNCDYRQINSPTDVLAFAALEAGLPYLPQEIVELGDIVISVETAKRQAEQLHHSLPGELAWLASHGLLHLLGWDHPDQNSLDLMLQQQESLLKLVGLLTEDLGVKLTSSDYT